MNINLPFLRTGIPEIDKAFRIACGDFFGNIGLYQSGLLESSAPVIFAGSSYPSPWTRDASFNTWYGGFIAPEAAKNSLLAVIESNNGKVIIGEACRQYWDQIIWAIGAWNYFLYTNDHEFLTLALEVIENSLVELKKNEFDEQDGLFRGGACFQDGIAGYPEVFLSKHKHSGIIHYVTDKPDHAVIISGGGLPMKAMSTNCLYYAAYQIADNIRALRHLPSAHKETLAKLYESINSRFYDIETGTYRYLLDAEDPDPLRQEGLGHAFAVLFGLAEPGKWQKMIKHIHTTPFGLPCVWPQYERYARKKGDYGRHSGVLWPQVNAAWCCALVKAGYRSEAWREAITLAGLAVKNNMFHEIYHPETGLPYGGLQEEGAAGVIEWDSCPRQTWAASGFIQMILTSLFGIKLTSEGISFDPVLPEECDSMQLSGFCYRNATINIMVEFSQDESMTVNGVPMHKIPITLNSEINICIRTPNRIFP